MQQGILHVAVARTMHYYRALSVISDSYETISQPAFHSLIIAGRFCNATYNYNNIELRYIARYFDKSTILNIALRSHKLTLTLAYVCACLRVRGHVRIRARNCFCTRAHAHIPKNRLRLHEQRSLKDCHVRTLPAIEKHPTCRDHYGYLAADPIGLAIVQ